MDIGSKDHYKVIGIMSGTSLDGLDFAYCSFTRNRQWSFSILQATTVKYSSQWRSQLSQAHQLMGQELHALDVAYGKYIGTCCSRFIRQHNIRAVDLLASHGHTIFHRPKEGFTYQLGSGAAIHAVTGLPVVFDFRSQDMALGGQGAPLVPVGDRDLFKSYDVCLNLGGIAIWS